jgi:rhamnosyltransferase
VRLELITHMEMTVSLVIPTLDAVQEIQPLLEVLLRQTRPADEIVVVNSSSEDNTVDIVQSIAEECSSVRGYVINRNDFNHGSTRDKALREWTTGDIVLFMTQDVVPANERYIESIVRPFSDDRIAAVSGRQLPKTDARVFSQA